MSIVLLNDDGEFFIVMKDKRPDEAKVTVRERKLVRLVQKRQNR